MYNMLRATVPASTVGQVINRVQKSQILVINRVRILGNGQHNPTHICVGILNPRACALL